MKRALWILAAVSLLRFAFSFAYDLFPQEAYYFFYGQHLALSYFDHPPVLAWALRASSEVLGPTRLAIRSTTFVLTLATLGVFYLLARRFVPRARQPSAVLLFATTVLVSVLSLQATPDVPLMLLWGLSLHFLAQALFDGRRWGWVLGGLCMGLAFDSKYTAVFLQLGLLVFLLASRRHRPLLKTAWPYLSVLVAHVAMLPVYVWNAQHGFASFLFQSTQRAHSMGGRGFTLKYVAQLLGSQSALLLPPLLFAMVYVAARTGRLALQHPGRRSREKTLFLLAFFAPLFVLFGGLSLVTLVKPNWLMPVYLAGTLLAARHVSARLRAWNYGLSVLLHALVEIELLFIPVPLKSLDVWYGWRGLAEQVEKLQQERPNAFVFSDDEYKTSALLTFYLHRPVLGPNVIGLRGLQYDYVQPSPASVTGRDALYVGSERSEGKAQQLRDRLSAHFAACQEKEPIQIDGPGRASRRFRVFDCQGYRGPALGAPR